MTAYFCRECLINEVPPTARDGRCDWCRPSRRHSQPKPEHRPNTGLADLIHDHRRNDR